jgi:molybdopterin converting factor small subunit
MRIRVKLHGLLTTGMDFPDDVAELVVPERSDIAAVVEGFRERSALFDPRACLAIVAGVKVPLDHVLQDGDQVDLYFPFGGG